MIDNRLFDDLAARISEALRRTPAQDVERTCGRACQLARSFRARSSQDFEVQKKLLEHAQAKLAEARDRVARIEAAKTPGST